MLDQTVDPRIPFLIKLAGQQQGIAYQRPLSTLVAHDLALAVLRGEIAQPEQAARWLDQRVTPIPVAIPAGSLPGVKLPGSTVPPKGAPGDPAHK